MTRRLQELARPTSLTRADSEANLPYAAIGAVELVSSSRPAASTSSHTSPSAPLPTVDDTDGGPSQPPRPLPPRSTSYMQLGSLSGISASDSEDEEDGSEETDDQIPTEIVHVNGNGTTSSEGTPRGRRGGPARGSSLTELEKWALSPAPQGQKLQCKIIRRKDRMDKLNPRYELYISNRLDEPDNTKEFVLSAKKKKQGQASQYSISTVRDFSVKDNEGVIGMVRGNFLGTAFVVYDTGTNPFKSKRKREKGVRKEYAAVIYEPNIMGFKGPRKMTILLPGMTRQGTRTDIEPLEQKDTLLERYRNQNDREILTVYNKAPQWNEETGSFVLNFNGRVTLASVKNFQVVHDNDLDYIILQFGRVSEDTFTIDFAYPMSPLQAFGIALTSFDAKLACE